MDSGSRFGGDMSLSNGDNKKLFLHR